ncbi:MAG: hypothetical protein OXM03_09690 [Chloroflexota bacterium]|nr:hypothetical protein [Chloroflexota bacterium]MDE2840885.1 hypothetical protein [Chloroflexota bacterium]MDE2929840.1 hypothetical protein [Chloroflexota bacterium]
MPDPQSEQGTSDSSPRAAAESNGAPFDTVVIVGRGGYGAAPREELDRVVSTLAGAGCYRDVRYAFMEQGKPALPAVLEECMAAGARRLLIVPALVPMDATLRWWLPLAIRDWVRENVAEDAMEVVLAPPLGDSEYLGEAVSAAVTDVHNCVEVRDDPNITDRERSWNLIPAHGRQVFLCHGPRCTLANAPKTWAYFQEKLRDSRLRGEQGVMTVRTGCLYPCDLGPMMVVHPDGTWYGGVDEAAVDRIVAEHLVDGEAVPEYACVPGAPARSRPGSEGS